MGLEAALAPAPGFSQAAPAPDIFSREPLLHCLFYRLRHLTIGQVWTKFFLKSYGYCVFFGAAPAPAPGCFSRAAPIPKGPKTGKGGGGV